MSVRLADIAKKLNISVAAASLAINNKPGVSEMTRKRVLQLCDEMGYKYSALNGLDDNDEAQFSGRNSSIVLWICRRHGNVISETPFFLALLEGIENGARENGYDVIYSSCKVGETKPETIHKRANKLGVVGMIILATELFEEDMQPFMDSGKPFVVLDANFSSLKCNSVLIDNINGTDEIVQYIVDCGHMRIGHLKSKVCIKNFVERETGYKNALRRNNIPIQEKFEFLVDSTVEGAYNDMCGLLEAGRELPTAFFADNDIIAFGAMKALNEYGISMPDRVSVVGFDDMPFCEMTSPTLTTVKVFKQNMGKIGVSTLMMGLHGGDGEYITVRVGTTIIARNSVCVVKKP